jgi:hypothetical protein
VVVIAVITGHAFPKFDVGCAGDQLRENGPAKRSGAIVPRMAADKSFRSFCRFQFNSFVRDMMTIKLMAKLL